MRGSFDTKDKRSEWIRSAGTPSRLNASSMASIIGGGPRRKSRAGRLDHDAVDSGDLLVAVLDEPAGLAATVLRALDADPADVRAALDETPAEEPASDPPIGADVRRAIDGAIAEARGQTVTVAHLFLGLPRTPGSKAGQTLGAHGITRPAALAQLLGLAGRPTKDPA